MEAVAAISMKRRLGFKAKIQKKFLSVKEENDMQPQGLVASATSWIPYDRTLQKLQVSAVKKVFDEE